MTEDRDDGPDPRDWLAHQFAAEPVPGAQPPAPQPFPPPAEVQAPPPPSLPPTFSGGFQWGLTPGGSDQPESPVAPRPSIEPPAAIAPQLPPTAAFTFDPEATAAFTFDPTEAFPALDPSLDGVTEALAPHPIGLPDPVDEGLEASAIDSLFGDTQFREYADEPLISPLPPRASSELVRLEGPKPRAPRAAIPKAQKILMWVAGALLAALALVALFAVGTRISHLFGPAPAVAVSASPRPSATPGPAPLGPVLPGEYQWDALLGGECLDPYESPWQDRYTVVDCSVPHPAQMVYRGLFADAADVAYPGVEELQKRINLLCTAPTIIDYAAAATTLDIQVAASFAADAADWDDGDRTYFCFVNRSGGEPLGASIAVPQVAPVTPVTPAP